MSRALGTEIETELETAPEASGVELECEYRRAPLSTVMVVVCVGLAILFGIGALAKAPDGGQVSSAQPVYAVLAVALGVLALVATVWRALLGRQVARIVLTDTAILLPKSSWSSREVAIDYCELREIYRSTWYAQSFINIVHQRGKQMIPISCLPSAEAFEEILSRLRDRVTSEAGPSERGYRHGD